jgi:hypothetical protein
MELYLAAQTTFSLFWHSVQKDRCHGRYDCGKGKAKDEQEVYAALPLGFPFFFASAEDL